MSNDTTDTRKRIIFISLILGMMFGVAVFLVIKAVTSDKLVLLTVLLPLFITSIPMVRTLMQLRKSSAGVGGTPQNTR